MSHITPANVQLIQNLQNQVYISTANESTNGSQITFQRTTGQQISKDRILTSGNGQTFSWEFQLAEGSVVNTANSYIHYKGKFTFNYTLQDTEATINADATTDNEQIPQQDPEQGAALVPGRYTVLDSTLWCEPAILIKASGVYSFTKFGKPQAVCQFPLNSAVIINSTRLNYGSAYKQDEYVYQQRPLYQANLAEEYQALCKAQYFDQNIDAVMRFVVCDQTKTDTYVKNNPTKLGTYIATAGEKQKFVQYKTFIISLNFVNQLFDLKGKFYNSAFSRTNVKLDMKLQPFTFAKMFFTEAICDVAGTGIEEMDLIVYQKASQTIQSDLSQKNQYIQQYNCYTRDGITLSGGLSASSSAFLSSGHKSSNDVYLCLNIPDESNWDSTVIKQRMTLFNSTQIMQIQNDKVIEEEFIFFHNLNIERGGAQFRYFSEPLQNPDLMMRETERSYNVLQQYQSSMSPSFNLLIKQMIKYAFVRVNLEAYKQESLSEGDVVCDGYNSEISKILIKTGFQIYNMNQDTKKNYATENIKPNFEIKDKLFNLYVFQVYDEFLVINPQNGTMKITEDLGSF